jgi:hypothetical protein
MAEENIDRWVPEQQYNCPNWPRPGYMGFGVNYSENYLTPNYLLVAGNKAINTCESMIKNVLIQMFTRYQSD